MKIGGLFFGYGGLDMAVQSVLGDELAWVSEIDKGACKIIEHRYPGVPNLGDITAVDWSQVEPVDVLTGGSPCQDLSHAGRRAGMTEGTRSNLWVAMREAIAVLRPRLVVWENVRGAYSAAADSALESCPGCVGDGPGPHLRALGRVLGDLSDLGYDASWHGLRAADVGAPHGRFRVFVAAADARRVREGRAAVPGEAASRRPHRDAAGRGDEPLTLLGTPRVTTSNMTPSAAMTARGETKGRLEQQIALLPTPDNENRQTDGYGGEDGNFHGLLRDPARWGDYAAAIARWEHVLGHAAPEPTQTSRKGNPQLSPRFVEWMMGLPAGWVTDVPDITRNEALKALGNGVVPQQAAEALRVMASWEVAA